PRRTGARPPSFAWPRSGRFSRLAAGGPGLLVAGRLGPAAPRKRRADRAMRARRAGEIGSMRLPPGPRRDIVLRRRDVDRVVQPAVPLRRHDRSLGNTAVNHPAALEAERRIDLAALRSVIAIAEFVLAHQLAIERRPQQRAKGGAVPPCEEAQEKRFHLSCRR